MTEELSRGEMFAALKGLGITGSPKNSNEELKNMIEEAEKNPPRLTPENLGVNEIAKVEEKMSVNEADEDYLQKYQYRKQTDFGSPSSNPPKGSKADLMKQHLLSQPRVRIFIPKNLGEKGVIRYTVNINGYRLDLPKNTYIEIPEQVAEVIQNSLQQTEEALARNRIESADKINALSR